MSTECMAMELPELLIKRIDFWGSRIAVVLIPASAIALPGSRRGVRPAHHCVGAGRQTVLSHNSCLKSLGLSGINKL